MAARCSRWPTSATPPSASAAAAAERARLARAVHDGVLQVLALVQRRGAELGGEAAELGRLAGEQEAALRTLIRAGRRAPPPGPASCDLAAELARLAAVRRVSRGRAGRAGAAAGATVVAELVAVVAACLDNVAAPRRATTRRRGCCSRSCRTGSR